MGVFGYSDEEGAGAFHLDGKLSPDEIDHRRDRLMQIQRQISRRKKKSLVGRELGILLEGPSNESEWLWEGRTEMHAPEIDGKVFVNDFGPHEHVNAGDFHRCRITAAHDYDLVAELI
jgi:ribosomal protein S12 methylthiotransferase